MTATQELIAAFKAAGIKIPESPYATKKYPIEEGCGGIARKWLVEQLPQAKYPNALLELAMHPYFPCTFASFASVTEDILVDFLTGHDTLSVQEFTGFMRCVCNYGIISPDYILSDNLTTCPDKAVITKAKKSLESFEGWRHPGIAILFQMIEGDEVPQAVINNVSRFCSMEAYEKERENKKQPRNRRLKR